jgi:hypothetical protein
MLEKWKKISKTCGMVSMKLNPSLMSMAATYPFCGVLSRVISFSLKY